nr:MAG TPA: hypothetical protein [Caudoviricetes sp.]
MIDIKNPLLGFEGGLSPPYYENWSLQYYGKFLKEQNSGGKKRVLNK